MPQRINAVLEASLSNVTVHEVSGPMIKPFFVNSNFECSWSTDVLNVLAHRKHKFNPLLQGRKADFSVYLPIRDKKCYLLVLETKSTDYVVSKKNYFGRL
ncbi:6142_t:CDS:2 [Funneliformis caledonium]|uniref:6142_t:CDS:1 n=1 Tax=Funneliformis caledonium TaxID=1117310 RepID=A0A9N9DBS2_9GLOM|nr:6142_t:CDS:2 [Funneliformis caledonium]